MNRHLYCSILALLFFDNVFTRLNKKNAQNVSLDIDIINIALNIFTCFDPQGNIIRKSNERKLFMS